ncbi:MAG: DUF167 domain-containing protein [Gemmatimonadota bacterium]
MTGFVPRVVGGATRFAVRVQPRAAYTEVAGVHGAGLRVRVQAPPSGGAANAAVIDLLARSLGVPRSAVRFVSGVTSRYKIVEVDGVTAAEVVRLARGPHATLARDQSG